MAGSEKAERKEVEKEEKKKKKKSEEHKKSLVDKAQSTVCETDCVGKERGRSEGKRQKEEQESQGETTSGKIWKMALPSFDSDAELFHVDAAIGRLEPKGKTKVPEIIIVSDAVEGTFVDREWKRSGVDRTEMRLAKWFELGAQKGST